MMSQYSDMLSDMYFLWFGVDFASLRASRRNQIYHWMINRRYYKMYKPGLMQNSAWEQSNVVRRGRHAVIIEIEMNPGAT